MRKEHLKVRRYEQLAVLHVPSSLEKDTSDRVRAAMIACLNRGSANLVLDLGAVHYINSDGLRMLQDMQRHVNEREASIALANANDSVLRTLNITRLDRQLSIYPTVEEALSKGCQ